MGKHTVEARKTSANAPPLGRAWISNARPNELIDAVLFAVLFCAVVAASESDHPTVSASLRDVPIGEAIKICYNANIEAFEKNDYSFVVDSVWLATNPRATIDVNEGTPRDLLSSLFKSAGAGKQLGGAISWISGDRLPPSDITDLSKSAKTQPGFVVQGLSARYKGGSFGLPLHRCPLIVDTAIDSELALTPVVYDVRGVKVGVLLPWVAAAAGGRAVIFDHIVWITTRDPNTVDCFPALPLHPDKKAALRRWIEDLDAQDFDVRERARAAILSIGAPALSELRSCLPASNRELRGSLDSAIREIMLRALPLPGDPAREAEMKRVIEVCFCGTTLQEALEQVLRPMGVAVTFEDHARGRKIYLTTNDLDRRSIARWLLRLSGCYAQAEGPAIRVFALPESDGFSLSAQKAVVSPKTLLGDGEVGGKDGAASGIPEEEEP